MNIIFLFICTSFACVLFVAYFVWWDKRSLQLLRLRVKKLYASPLFAELIPILKFAQRRPLEQLIIDKTGIAIRFLEPVGSESYFSLREQGYPMLTPEKQEALLVLLEEFLPQLTDRHRYILRKKHRRLVNGRRETYYCYVIMNQYKMMLVRAPRYNGSLKQLGQ